MNRKQVDFSTLQTELFDINQWLGSLGFTNSHRITRYTANIAEIMAKAESSPAEKVYADIFKDGRVSEILSSIVEAVEFVDTITILREKRVQIPKNLLRNVLSGDPDAAKEDASSNAARNFMFELFIASSFAASGIKVTLAEPDVKLEFEGRRVLIACKRVLSEKGIEGRMVEAVGQVDKHSSMDGDVGLIAISVTRLINKGDAIWGLNGDEEITPFLTSKLEEIITAQLPSLNLIDSPRILGVLFHLATPVYVPLAGYSPARHAMAYPLAKKENMDFFRRLSDKFKHRF